MRGGWATVFVCLAWILSVFGLVELFMKGYIHGDTLAFLSLFTVGIIGFAARCLGWEGMIEHEHKEQGCWCEKEF